MKQISSLASVFYQYRTIQRLTNMFHPVGVYQYIIIMTVILESRSIKICLFMFVLFFIIFFLKRRRNIFLIHVESTKVRCYSPFSD